MNSPTITIIFRSNRGIQDAWDYLNTLDKNMRVSINMNIQRTYYVRLHKYELIHTHLIVKRDERTCTISCRGADWETEQNPTPLCRSIVSQSIPSILLSLSPSPLLPPLLPLPPHNLRHPTLYWYGHNDQEDDRKSFLRLSHFFFVKKLFVTPYIHV